MALTYRNSGSGPWYSTEGCRKAYIVPDGTLPCSSRRFRAGTLLGLSLDTQIAATSPDKSAGQVSCPVKGKCRSFASCKQNMAGFRLTGVTTCYRYHLLFKVKMWQRARQFLSVFLLAQIHTQRTVKVKQLPTPKLPAAQHEEHVLGTLPTHQDTCQLIFTFLQFRSLTWKNRNQTTIFWVSRPQTGLVQSRCNAISLLYHCDYTVWSAQANFLCIASAVVFNLKFLTPAMMCNNAKLIERCSST